ncbi:hypothetical protein CLV53_12825 [Sediminibacterium magnilacihabitans]|nr:hypothetical protein CLV53_12825 [Sediminibacterium magnilacihabitans]
MLFAKTQFVLHWDISVQGNSSKNTTLRCRFMIGVKYLVSMSKASNQLAGETRFLVLT